MNTHQTCEIIEDVVTIRTHRIKWRIAHFIALLDFNKQDRWTSREVSVPGLGVAKFHFRFLIDETGLMLIEVQRIGTTGTGELTPYRVVVKVLKEEEEVVGTVTHGMLATGDWVKVGKHLQIPVAEPEKLMPGGKFTLIFDFERLGELSTNSGAQELDTVSEYLLLLVFRILNADPDPGYYLISDLDPGLVIL